MDNLVVEHIPVHLALHGVPRPERLRARVRADFDVLKSDYADLRDCRVALEMVNGAALPRFCAHLDLRLPQRQIIISGEASETAAEALCAALAAARRHLALPPHWA